MSFIKNIKKTHRIPDGEKMFYLYLLKEANEVCDIFSMYFKGDINLEWWDTDGDRLKSLKHSKSYLE